MVQLKDAATSCDFVRMRRCPVQRAGRMHDAARVGAAMERDDRGLPAYRARLAGGG